jgi:acetylornithine deacetylase/succinyl-diaminopimelate desuccinylase-like protein
MLVCRWRSIVPVVLFASVWGNAALGQASNSWFFQSKGPAKASSTPPVVVRPLELDERLLARDVYQQLVETDTTRPTGSTTIAAEAMRQRLLQAGFSGSDVMIAGPTANRMNLVARYRGSSPGAERPILFIGHLDVVEARRDEWTVDPFKLTETNGYFYGRGTLDMKNSDAAFITSFLLLKKAGWVPKRDIILALTADEEGGGNDGVSWLLEHRRDLVDAEFAVNPDAGGLVLRDGKPAELDLEETEKVYADFALTAVNSGGHSSRPMPENAIYLVAGALGRIERSPFPAELNPVTRAYLEAEARHEGEEKRMLISRMLGPKEDMAAAQKLASLDPGYNAILRTTCVATMMNAGEAENALPAIATANVNCRILPGHSPEEVRKQLATIVSDVRVKVQYRGEDGTLSDTAPEKAAMVVPKLIPEVMKPLRAVTLAMWPKILIVPEMESGSSDSVYTSAAGIPTYGFSGMGIEVNDDRAHGRDERLLVSAFYDGVAFMKEMVRQMGEE